MSPTLQRYGKLRQIRNNDQIPAGLIVTGPNIASQELLFSQIAERLTSKTHRTVIVLRSGDASNLKTVLRKLIRDATNQKEDDGEETQAVLKDVSISQALC
jgi:origin recognition complex subunit 3